MPLEKKSFDVKLTCRNRAGGNAVKNFHCADEGFQAEVVVEEGGMPSKRACSLNLYGASSETIEMFTALVFTPLTYTERNMIEITSQGESVFKGDLIHTFGNYNAAPNIALQAQGILGYANSLAEQQNRVIQAKDRKPINTAFRELATAMGMSYQSSPDVQGFCPETTLQGTNHEQIWQLAKDCNVELDINDFGVRIAPKDKAFNETPIKISSTTGLIKYPIFTSNGVNFKTVFNPQIHIGSTVNIISAVPKSSGAWIVKKVSSKISTMPNGKWEQDVECCPYNRSM